MLSKLEEGDKLVVTKLDRLARNTKEGIEIIEGCLKRCEGSCVECGFTRKYNNGTFLLQTLLAVAEMERNLIIERTQEGKAIAKQQEGFREGRPNKYTKKQLDHAIQMLGDHSFKQVAEITGISMSTLKRESKSGKRTSLNNKNPF